MVYGDIAFFGFVMLYFVAQSGLFDSTPISEDEGDDDSRQVADLVTWARADFIFDETPVDAAAGGATGSDHGDTTLAHLMKDGDDRLIAHEVEAPLEASDDSLFSLRDDDLFPQNWDADNIFGGADDDGPEDEVEVFDVTDPALDPARITDFDATTDQLQIYYSPTFDPGTGTPLPPQVSVEYDSQADQLRVAVNGLLLATLEGAEDLSADDIFVDVLT